ncbi:PQQ-dependent sugar dehydrogenase [Croceitalea rosinachiae]|uniref:PQQ-dependent sugar dehydrogenase n=1 Tax=Croceitalea rosinachiae TaxID=3075596 RepID=A0ABU3AI12_9FLAO|nr:PQQ-dependent sugar dehydrogenase [Croceitalea sp. F388]MDT0608536.1 PQQ-dependent sugar dehydrogenase [Croceitalea sp. F388]
MKTFKFLCALCLLCAISCDTKDTDFERIEENNDDEPNNTLSVSSVNAFTGLSFSQPLDLQSPDDGTNRIFVVEKGGRIVVFENDVNVTSSINYLNLSNISTSGEQGLLGMAFHPNYQSNGYFYVCYTPSEGLSVISRFSVSADANVADASSELVLLEIPQPETNHNGGQIAFGPDGYLYIASGDGGGGGDPQNNAQNRTNLLGNILRIDVDNTDTGSNYSIPSDNPFVNDSDIRDEIYAYGFRNPWRMSFDTQTGILWTADVGQNELEEIDIVIKGGNYGWKLFEGTSCFFGDCDAAGLIAPIFEYNQNNGDRSITGGYVYRGSEVGSLEGKYIYGDFVSGRIWSLAADGSENELLLESRLSIASFGTDSSNELYVCAFDGTIYKFIETTMVNQ